MAGIGFPELVVLLVVALVVLGPDKLPEFARQSGRLIRQLRRLTQQARDDIRSELGPDYADFELTDLDPRRAIRKHVLEAWDDADQPGNGQPPSNGRPGSRPLVDGEPPPYDADAT
jgi:sec-independent protein translocase protein TatB